MSKTKSQQANIKFLHQNKVTNVALAGALDDSIERKVAKYACIPLLLGSIQAQDVAKGPKNKGESTPEDK